METKPVKHVFGTEYWVEKLVAVGKLLEPAKYTPEYIQLMHTKWRGKSMTRLVATVLTRQQQLQSLQSNPA